MLNIRFEGDKQLINGLQNVIQEISRGGSTILDRASLETKNKMVSEAPRGLSGRLARSVTISAPDSFTKIIGPLADYASYIEWGTGPSGGHGSYIPNLGNLADYYGIPVYINSRVNPLLWAIASTIKNRGTPAQPFVFETYVWLESQINKYIYPFLDKIAARYIEG